MAGLAAMIADVRWLFGRPVGRSVPREYGACHREAGVELCVFSSTVDLHICSRARSHVWQLSDNGEPGRIAL